MKAELQSVRVTDQRPPANDSTLLYHGIRNILRCDNAEVVSGIARYVVSQHFSLRFLSALIERTRGTPFPAVIALVGWLRALLSVRSGEASGGAVWIARLGNERHAIDKILPLVQDLNWTKLGFHLLPNNASQQTVIRSLRQTWQRVFHIARLLDRRVEFFKVLRVAELIGFYTRYLEVMQSGKFSLAVMSSHSNPHGIAFNLAARKCGVPVVLITHGMPIRPVARLSYELALVHCESARQTYIEEGCRMDRVLIHGRRQDYSPMPEGLPEQIVVGIFLCKDVNEERLRSVVEGLLKHARVSQVVIRPHPKNLWVGLDAWIASQSDRRLSRTKGGSVFADVQSCDIVLGGNSSVLVDAVTAGRPSCYVPGLDYGHKDLHTFVARGLVYQFDELNFEPEAILRFYQRLDWLRVLKLFANIDEDESTVASQVAVILRELAEQ